MTRIHIALAAALVALVVAAPASPIALPKLVGTVGPGFTITLTKGGVKVTKLKAGEYTLVVNDKASIHSFHISGPGLNKVVTSVAFVGTKTITITLKAGKYTYVCDPHRTILHGSFTVS